MTLQHAGLADGAWRPACRAVLARWRGCLLAGLLVLQAALAAGPAAAQAADGLHIYTWRAVSLPHQLNLASAGALRYTDAGGVPLAARRSAGGRVRLQVWDTGRGIAVAQQAAVFEEFVQIDNPQRERSQGLGLGLAIVQRSAALLGAGLALRSQPGRGSCFNLDLAADHGPMPAMPPPALAERWLAGQRLVLVEDDPAVRDAQVSRLSAWGAEVQAHDGPRAQRTALDATPPGQRQAHLLITDLRLPDGSGWDVVALARRRYGQLPVLVITGNSAPADIATLAASGLTLLHKPFRAEELHAAIVAAVGPPTVSG